MFDKEYTINLINEVIKNDIIPSLNNDVAKEQAIAMISVLKNVNANTVQNVEPYEKVNELLDDELTLLCQKILKDRQLKHTALHQNIIELQKSLAEIKAFQDTTNRWKALNELTSRFIKCLYEEHEAAGEYISQVRKLLRQQLNIEMTLVS